MWNTGTYKEFEKPKWLRVYSLLKELANKGESSLKLDLDLKVIFQWVNATYFPWPYNDNPSILWNSV